MQSDLRRMLEDYYEAWSSHDMDRIASFFTDDCLYDDVPMSSCQHGKEELKTSWSQFFTTCPDFRVEPKAIFGGGEWACSEWVMTGTQSGDWPGMPATGKRFSIVGASIIELSEGRIRRNADYWDMVSLLTQLGFMPDAPEQ